jgi:hypothetical protein
MTAPAVARKGLPKIIGKLLSYISKTTKSTGNAKLPTIAGISPKMSAGS